jgi:hypothetical protein
VLLVSGLLVTGCGSDLLEVAQAPPTTAPSAKLKPDPPKGVDDPNDYEDMAPVAEVERLRAEWLRSDYVRNLDPRTLETGEDMANYGRGPDTFEQALDEADLVVSGEVTGLLFIPEGIITTFRVDRTAKGRSAATIQVLQNNSLDRDGDTARLVIGRVPMVFEGDRAVLLLKEYASTDLMGHQQSFVGDRFAGVPLYRVEGATGQFRSEGGKVRAEETRSVVLKPDRRFDGKTEDEMLDAIAQSQAEPHAEQGEPKP